MVVTVTQSQVQSYRSILRQVESAALVDVQELLAASNDWPVEVRNQLLFEAFPEVLDPYAAGVSELSTQFYEELREQSGVRTRFTPQVLSEGLEDRSVKSLLGFATTTGEEDLGAVFRTLAGGVTKRLTELAADTIIGNAEADRVVVGYQRVPQAGCCAFCGMLASRGASYSSEAAAGTVVGRGKPVGASSGGKGVRSSGSRRVGESFHDHCRCSVVAVFPDTEVEMQARADEYYDAYSEAHSKAREGLSWQPKQEATGGAPGSAGRWVRDGRSVAYRQTQSEILAFMRDTLGVK